MTTQEKRTYDHILKSVSSTPWAIRPEVLDGIVDLLAFRAAGGQLTGEEIRERVGGRPSRRDTTKRGTVAVIPVYGVLSPRVDGIEEMSGGTSLDRIRGDFREAIADDSVTSVVLDIDSPGGSVAGIPEFAAEIQAARGTKPIIAVANTDAASAAYWIGAQADELVVSPSGEVGSIGVWSAHRDRSDQQAKQGVKTTLISAGKFKTEGHPFGPLSDEAKDAMQSTVDAYYEMFLSAVAEGRRTTVEDVRENFGEGRMVMATRAVSLGMADKVSTLEATVARLDRSHAESRKVSTLIRAGAHSIDPSKYHVEMDGRRVPLAQVAEARDFVRQSHMALEPFQLTGIEVRDSKAGKGQFTIRGHAAVFNRLSHDLGGFREKIAPGFFTEVLDANPDVHALWDHDTRWTLARTKNKTLELREDPMGLHNWMRVAPTSFAQDLRVLMERGDIDQQSFAFTVAEDDWVKDDEGNITRTLLRAENLYDVTITAQGAYPQTGAEVVRQVRSVLDTSRTVFAVGYDNDTDDAEAIEAGDEETRDAAATKEAIEVRTAALDEAGSDEASDDDVDAPDEELEARKVILLGKIAERKATLKELEGRLQQL